MNKLQYFTEAMKAGEYRRLAWIISAFSLTSEGPDDWKNDPYPYRIVQRPSGFFFVDPQIPYTEPRPGYYMTPEAIASSGLTDANLIRIDGAKPGEPLFSVAEQVQAAAGTVLNMADDEDTSYGRLLANQIVLCHSFGSKIPYQNKKFSAGDIEKVIVKLLRDTPKEGEERKPNLIYVDEYLNFTNAMFGTIAAMTQLCVPAATPRTMTSDPRVAQVKKDAFKEFKDGELVTPAALAKAEAELLKVDREWIDGDPDGAADFLITAKSMNVVRKKQFLTQGAEAGFGDGTQLDLIKNSLEEGWQIEKFPAMNNSLRMGSFNRGAQTEKGGESYKWLLRASSNIRVTQHDCGSKMGLEIDVGGENWGDLVGLSIITDKGPQLMDEESAKSMVGKKVYQRTVAYCQLDKTDYCEVCVGERLANNPTALSAAIADYGSAFLYMFMSAMHGKALSLARFKYKSSIF